MKNKISIVGAGPVGSLLAIILKQKGFSVKIFEKRKNPGKFRATEGKSINLALSHRGIQSLKLIDVYEKLKPFLIPMNGRMIHNESGNLTYQPYGKKGQCIHSVSRARLNGLLVESAEQSGVDVYFDYQCKKVDFDSNTLIFENGHPADSDVIIGTDGAFSVTRKQMQLTDRFNFSQHYIEHGYKELTMAPKEGKFQLIPDHLHIWPRGNFMLIALPNSDKTFTCTLFFPFEGELSFSTLNTKEKVNAFFEEYFKDLMELIPDFTEQFFSNPTSSLVTIKCEPWYRNQTILLGDAAHAIVPFYGQGLNSGFEDVKLFVAIAEQLNWNWDTVLPYYSAFRKKDTDALSELTLQNFIEMRDHVGNPSFLKRQELESQIQKKYPKEWIPLYSMVTFSNIPYSEALRLGKIQEDLMSDVLKEGNPIDFERLFRQFNALKTVE